MIWRSCDVIETSSHTYVSLFSHVPVVIVHVQFAVHDGINPHLIWLVEHRVQGRLVLIVERHSETKQKNNSHKQYNQDWDIPLVRSWTKY